MRIISEMEILLNMFDRAGVDNYIVTNGNGTQDVVVDNTGKVGFRFNIDGLLQTVWRDDE